MENKNKTRYGPTRTFTPEERDSICPQNIYEYMCLRVYGKADPSPDDNPVGGRSTTLAYMKKAILYFMTSTTEWNEAIKTGNPTKS